MIEPPVAVAGAGATRALLAIDGVDGSGKSRFAEELREACAAAGLAAALVHVDDFRRPVDWSAAGADEAALYYDRYYDLPLLDACLRRLLDGEDAVRVPRFDSTREALDGELELRASGASLVIVEGIFVLRLATAAAAPLIVLQVSDGEARRRLLARDLGRGRPRPMIEHRLERRYLPAQHRYRAAFDPTGRADVLVDNEDWERPRMLRCEAARLPAALAGVLVRRLSA